ncbi:NlpC/P60 family protein [Fredinandcohnia sp. QZ13]|uniref:coiled-coil domain-containing protein n=1 Tax=Fredinandcohnia sp. QZ13 TaxID=3073144 RepID=UPI0028534B66|nr:NlpC/P60 family protein [Fredinandcohnia sp. QZ13]MDR4888066.1 NlpC/P60 family protein [Fredinandcohnia sp. QZ13]
MKKTLVTLSATLMISAFSPYVMQTSANTISTLQSDLSETQNALKELNAQIAKVDQAIEDNRKMIAQTEEDIKESEAQVHTLQAEIDQLEKEIEARNEILKERARMMQESGGTISYLDVIFGAQNFSDFINRVSAVSTIMQADQKIIDEQAEAINLVKEKQDTIQETLTSLNSKKEELVAMQGQIEDQKAQNDALKASLQSKEQKTLADIEDLRASMIAATPAVTTTPTNSTSTASSTPTASAPAVPTSTPKVTGSISTVINAGYKYIGNSVYVFGGGRSAYDIANGRFDCSGFVHWAFAQAGVSVGASTDSLKNQGTAVSVSDMKPGDLVFFNTYKTDGHVGIYIGGGKFIGSQSSTGVAIANMTSGYWKNTFNGRVKRIMN